MRLLEYTYNFQKQTQRTEKGEIGDGWITGRLDDFELTELLLICENLRGWPSSDRDTPVVDRNAHGFSSPLKQRIP